MRKKLGHIFLVDDNHDMRFYLSDMLSQMGYTVDPFDNAQTFLGRSADISPAVVLLDMRMPGLSGLQLQSRLEVMGRKTPIVFISGESDKDEIIEAFRLGAVDFLLKPFTREKLCLVIDKALALDHQRSQALHSEDAIKRSLASLSRREKEIFMLVVQGMTNKGISEVTGIQAGTAKKHRATIYQKLAVSNTAELIQQCKGVDLYKILDLPPMQPGLS
jgi:FixJ family two-component response regulator